MKVVLDGILYINNKHNQLSNAIQLKTTTYFLLRLLTIRHVEEYFVKNCKLRRGISF
jgi:hypothetical protein